METPESAPKVYDLTSFRSDVQKVIGRYAKMLEGDNPKVTGAAADAIRADLVALHAAIAANGEREATPAMAAEQEQDGGRLNNVPIEIAVAA